MSLGTVNSRYKDLYDLYELLIKTDLDDDRVVAAACNTFKNRNTILPELPESLTEPYWASETFNTDWSRYLKRIEATEPDQKQLIKFLLPRLHAIYSTVRAKLKYQVEMGDVSHRLFSLTLSLDQQLSELYT